MAQKVNPDTGRVNIGADPDQIRSWLRAADRDYSTLTSWIRKVCDAAAEKSTRPAKKRRSKS